jgi:hypothetical protein
MQKGHRRVMQRLSPHFHGAIGAMMELTSPLLYLLLQWLHIFIGTEKPLNVLEVCDFDMRFTFVVSGWPDVMHDMRVFNETLDKYADKFPFPLEGTKISTTTLLHWHYIIDSICDICVGTYYLVDSGYLIKRVSFHHTRERSIIY